MSGPVRRPAIFPSAYWPAIGGVEELTRQLVRHQRVAGLDPVVLTHRWPKSLPSHEQLEETEVHRIDFRFPAARPRHLGGWLLHGPAAKTRTRATLTGHGADLIHVQCVSTNGHYALDAARRTGLPLVVTLQGELTMDAGQIYQRSSLMRAMWRRLLSRADAITTCSAQVLAEAEGAHGSLGERARVLPNGVDLSEVEDATPLSRPRPFLFAVGRMVPQKGFDLLVRAFAQIADRHPDHDLVIAGEGPERAGLQRLVTELGLQGRVELPGPLDHGRVLSHMAAARCFVLPSRHEPQGIVVLEAMAAGAPVVAAAVGGVPETVGDGVTGLLVEGNDVAALRDGIGRLLDEPSALTHARAERARELARERSWTRTTQAYLEVYAAARERSAAR